METSIRILLVDDHAVFRLALREALNCEAGLRVVAEASSAAQALEAVRRYQPDITLMDLRMAPQSGVQITAGIRREFPAARIIMLSIFDGEENIRAALKAGALAYVPKTEERARLIELIRSVHRGESLPIRKYY